MRAGFGRLAPAAILNSISPARPAWLPNALYRMARAALALTIILIPFCYRVVWQARPYPPVYRDYTDFLNLRRRYFSAGGAGLVGADPAP